MLSSSAGYELSGQYKVSTKQWTIDEQFARPNARHLVLNGEGTKLEAIVIARDGYFRGQEFLAQRLGQSSAVPGLAQAAGSAWWKDTVSLVPTMPDFTDGTAFRATFLGSAANRRTDHNLSTASTPSSCRAPGPTCSSRPRRPTACFASG